MHLETTLCPAAYYPFNRWGNEQTSCEWTVYIAIFEADLQTDHADRSLAFRSVTCRSSCAPTTSAIDGETAGGERMVSFY